jgi:hypothetical protein
MIDTLISALFWISATLFSIILILVVAMAWIKIIEMERDHD